MAFLITGLMLLNLHPIAATSTTTSTTSPVVAQLDVTVVSVDVPAGTTTTTQGQTVLQTTAHDQQGAMVIGVLPHSPATAVLHQGDVITTCNAVPVHTASDLNSCANAAGAARTLCLTLARHGALLTTNVVLTKKP
jgi:S1-C subfamily serine protease